MFRLFLIIILANYACGRQVKDLRTPTPFANPSHDATDANEAENAEAQPEEAVPREEASEEAPPEQPKPTPLEAAVAYWQSFAPMCEDRFPSKENCDDGDATLFNGLLCAAGFPIGCKAVADAQGRSGQWWRSPRRVDGNLGEDRSFSRDMSLGVLLYLAKTGDTAAAGVWLDWLEDNRPCAVENPVTGGCSVRGLHRFCRDDGNGSCTITPNIWSLMADVWQSLNLNLHPNMEQFRNSFESGAATEARNTEPGYQLHLKGVQVFLKKLLNQESGGSREVTSILVEKQPDNPFFRYLAQGYSQDLEKYFLELCPPPEGGEPDFARHQWAWERDTASAAWEESMGWDCLFIAKLKPATHQP